MFSQGGAGKKRDYSPGGNQPPMETNTKSEFEELKEMFKQQNEQHKETQQANKVQNDKMTTILDNMTTIISKQVSEAVTTTIAPIQNNIEELTKKVIEHKEEIDAKILSLSTKSYPGPSGTVPWPSPPAQSSASGAGTKRNEDFLIDVYGFQEKSQRRHIIEALTTVVDDAIGLHAEIGWVGNRTNKGSLKFTTLAAMKTFLTHYQGKQLTITCNKHTFTAEFKKRTPKHIKEREAEGRQLHFQLNRLMGFPERDPELLEFNGSTLEVYFGNEVIACWCNDKTPIKEKLNRTKHKFVVDMDQIDVIRNKRQIHFKIEDLKTTWSQWVNARANMEVTGSAQ